MDQIGAMMQNVSSMATSALNYIEAQTGFPPVVFFTVFALIVGAYYLISGILVPSQIGTAPNPNEHPSPPAPVPVVLQLGGISESELLQYDGKHLNKPVLIAIRGEIYDVSSARAFYGPGGPYAVYAGKDASRAIAKGSFEEEDVVADLNGLSEKQLEGVKEWEKRLSEKHAKVGFIVKNESKSKSLDDAEVKPTTEEAAAEEEATHEEQQSPVSSEVFDPTPEEQQSKKKDLEESKEISSPPENHNQQEVVIAPAADNEASKEKKEGDVASSTQSAEI